MADLFQLGNFTLSSGAVSRWKIDCDALSDASIQTLAQMVRQMVGEFSSVEGVPRGGLRLAEALRSHCSGTYFPHLIVDDVLTSGGSMNRAFDRVKSRVKKDRGVVGAVIFARGECPQWVKVVFQCPYQLWIQRT